MRHPPAQTRPPADRPIPCSAAPPGLWHALTPQRRQQMAQGLAELIARMRLPGTPASPESHHDQL